MARAIVVGAGVVGAASAYALAKAGHEVILVDRHAEPARGASRANGAQLSYSYGDALASPTMLAHLPAILLGRDPAYRARLQADPEFLVWGLRFIANATPGRFMANTRHLLAMADDTRVMLEQLLSEFELDFDHSPMGKMILYPTASACEKGRALRQLKISMGLRQDILDRAAATALEPALDLYPDPIGAVLYSPDDAAGRPDRFCTRLIEALRRHYGLMTVFGHEIRSVRAHRGRVVGIGFRDREPIDADIVVMATGAATDALPIRDRPFGGVWPVQGYSMTAAATSSAMAVSVTDVKRKIVFARIGNHVRMAGLADIGPRRFAFDADRFQTFRTAAVEAFGAAFDHARHQDLRPWSEGRPCTPSSRPIIRAGSLAGLFLNLGHGTLGWTLCLGAARQLMRIMAFQTTH